jgi:hypothetical protein
MTRFSCLTPFIKTNSCSQRYVLPNSNKTCFLISGNSFHRIGWQYYRRRTRAAASDPDVDLHHFQVVYTYFPDAVFAIFHTSLTLVFVCWRYNSVTAKVRAATDTTMKNAVSFLWFSLSRPVCHTQNCLVQKNQYFYMRFTGQFSLIYINVCDVQFLNQIIKFCVS